MSRSRARCSGSIAATAWSSIAAARLRGPGKQRDRIHARDWLAYVTSRYTSAGLSAVAKALAVDPSCMSRGIQRVEARLENPEGHATLERLLALLDQTACGANHKSQV